LTRKPNPTASKLTSEDASRKRAILLARRRPVAAGMMIKAPASNAPMNRRPMSTVKLKASRKPRFNELSLMPVAAANSGENKFKIKALLYRKMKETISATVRTPMTNVKPEIGSNLPKNASTRSYFGVRAAPIATEPANTTPIDTSVEKLSFFCNSQISSVPMKSVAPPPSKGLKCHRKAKPRTGNATCEMTSAARIIRFIRAKLPTKPAATANKNARIML